MLGTITLTGKKNNSIRSHLLHLNNLKFSSVLLKTIVAALMKCQYNVFKV